MIFANHDFRRVSCGDNYPKFPVEVMYGWLFKKTLYNNIPTQELETPFTTFLYFETPFTIFLYLNFLQNNHSAFCKFEIFVLQNQY